MCGRRRFCSSRATPVLSSVHCNSCVMPLNRKARFCICLRDSVLIVLLLSLSGTSPRLRPVAKAQTESMPLHPLLSSFSSVSKSRLALDEAPRLLTPLLLGRPLLRYGTAWASRASPTVDCSLPAAGKRDTRLVLCSMRD